ncbi:MAG: DUF4321 domain-containing protein [Gemmatimonadetes bacterium]|jgi:hypothetical protein|nr:DUF4321 domain-containing protein [Gemmatimonadota bacterium]MBP6668631.1 DUF4321 domain-containing protein [Gemmatimonadales bacterium]MBK6779508.1 DUF4321 domain-containing protein [Gemmatimonadota bacterium]MBK7350229.1 DUF4321 domain-containing protein [Gemmatimonadota bacterium]MBK7716250.1 DUF4321 domain-containing protein [Gemmatimonadota bacterium]
MASGPRRPMFHLGVLVAGFVLGGFLNALVKTVMPDSVAKQVFTFSASASVGPVSLDLLVFSFTLGPFAMNVTPLAILGVIVAYLIARSLF